MNGVLAQPEVKAKLEVAGAIVQPMSVAQVKEFVQAESRKYLAVIKETGASAE
jgi:tripartite-type tricarboxylate transporter receptor subunit TctC